IFSTDGSPHRISWAVCAAELLDALEAGEAGVGAAAASTLEAEARVEHGCHR
ncbi:MAG: hypothetical protein GY696_40605, partial [Gammaproteobacteria bacterium]|nr:hypothetical protein [Gammaproteobacteria bacterium]